MLAEAQVASPRPPSEFPSKRVEDLDSGILAFRFRELYIFPLFDECCRTVRLPYWISTFLPLILFVQNIGATLWIGSSHIWADVLPEPMRILFGFCDLGLHNRTLTECWPQLAVLYLIICFSLVFLWIVFIYYRTNKSFSRWQMYLVTVLVYNVWPILLTPLACVVGRAIVAVNAEPTPARIGILFVTSLVLPVVNILTSFCFNFICKSPCLQNAVLAMWDPDTVMLLLWRIEYCASTSIWIQMFPDWINVLALVIGIVIMLYEAYLLYFMPMCVFWMNGFSLGTVIYAISNSVALIVYLFTRKHAQWAAISGIIIGFFGICGSSLWFYLRRKKMIRLLTRGRDGKLIMEKAEKYNHFDTIVFSSTRDVCAYLRVAIANACPFLIDFSFVKYLLESYGGERQVLFACLRTTALFPFANSLLAASLPVLDSLNRLTLGEEFQIYQLKKINLARQMQTIYFNDDEFNELEKKSAGVISQIRGFWIQILRSETDISFSALHYLRKQTLAVDSLFFDAIEQWPGSQTLNNMYVTFMIEAEANYSSAIRYEKKRQMMVEGKLVIIDYVFRSLVSLYPHYLYDRLVDTKGRRVDIGESFSYHAEQFDCESSTNVETDDVDLHYDEIIQDLISHGKLRLAVQNCLRGLKFKPNIGNMILAFLQVLLVIIMIIIILEEVRPYVAEGITVVTSNNKLAKIALEIQYVSLIAGIELVTQDGYFGGTQQIIDTLKLSAAQVPDYPSIMHDPYMAMHNTALNIHTLAREESTVIVNSENPDLSERDLLYTRYHGLPMVDTTPGFNISVNIRSGVVLFHSEAEVGATEGAACHDCKVKILLTGLSLSQHFSDIIKELIPERDMTDGHDYYTVKISVGATIGILFVYLMFRVVSVNSIWKEMKMCSRVLRSVKPNAVYDSFHHICLREKRDIMFIASAQSTSRLSYVVILYPLTIVVSTAIVAGVLIKAANVYSEDIKFVRGVWYMSRFSFVRALESVSELVRLFAYVYDLEKLTAYRPSNWADILGWSQRLNYWGLQIGDTYADFYMMSPPCPQEATHYADIVQCGSLSSQIDIFMHYCLDLWGEVGQKKFDIFKSPTFDAIIYLFDTRVYDGFLEVSEQIQMAVENDFKDANTRTTVLFVIAVVVSLISLLVENRLCHVLSMSFEAFKQLLLLLSPTYIAKEPVLIDYATGQTGQYAKSGSESMLENSIYAVLSVDKGLFIQSVSQGFSTLTGFTPDQSLGQPLSWLIPDQRGSQAAFYQKLRQMISDCDETISKMTVPALTENGETIYVKAVVIARFDKDKSLIQFIILLRDLSNEIARKQMLKQLKARSDMLIHSLLPEPVCQRIGGHDLPVYNVKHATLVYIEMIGVSDAVHTTLPDILMNMIESTFEIFDNANKNHTSIVPIDRWDGVYTAVCGLFQEFENHEGQLTEVLSFCFEIRKEVELLNEKLGADIHLKFAVSAGGPMVASFLGLQNPVFQIMSPITDVAKKILEVGEPDMVHIPGCLQPLVNVTQFKTDEMDIESITVNGKTQKILFVNAI